MAKRKHKVIECKGPLPGALEDGLAELGGLQEEMEEWASNMEGGNLSATSKCETVRASADSLANVPDSIDLPDGLDGIEIAWTETKHYGRGLPRAARRDNAVAALNAALSAIQSRLEQLEEVADDGEQEEGDDEGVLDELRSVASEIGDAVSAAEEAEFPGMYG